MARANRNVTIPDNEWEIADQSWTAEHDGWYLIDWVRNSVAAGECRVGIHRSGQSGLEYAPDTVYFLPCSAVADVERGRIQWIVALYAGDIVWATGESGDSLAAVTYMGRLGDGPPQVDNVRVSYP